MTLQSIDSWLNMIRYMVMLKNVNLVAEGVWKVSHRLYFSKMITPIHIGKSHSTISSRTSYKHFIWKHKGMFDQNFF